MGALCVRHTEQAADDLGGANPVGSSNLRPESASSVTRLVTRSEKEQRRAVFCGLLERRGTIAAIARAWGVSDAVVRRVRDGLAPLTDERIAALPAATRAAFERRMAAPIQLRLEGI